MCASEYPPDNAGKLPPCYQTYTAREKAKAAWEAILSASWACRSVKRSRCECPKKIPPMTSPSSPMTDTAR